VVSVAVARARELGFEVLACASTGNLANSVAAQSGSSEKMKKCGEDIWPAILAIAAW